jgi:hypothetical protein
VRTKTDGPYVYAYSDPTAPLPTGGIDYRGWLPLPLGRAWPDDGPWRWIRPAGASVPVGVPTQFRCVAPEHVGDEPCELRELARQHAPANWCQTCWDAAMTITWRRGIGEWPGAPRGYRHCGFRGQAA